MARKAKVVTNWVAMSEVDFSTAADKSNKALTVKWCCSIIRNCLIITKQ